MASESGRELQQHYERQAQRACVLVAEGKGDDAQLKAQVFMPAAEALVANLKMFLGEVTQSSRHMTEQYVSESHTHQMTEPDEPMRPLSPSDPAILSNAASNIADLITDRYRDALRQKGASYAAQVTYKSPGENGLGNLARIGEDVRLYCQKLQAAGVTELFDPSYRPR